MTPALSPDGMAATHAAAFNGHGWPEADFTAYLTDPGVRIFGTDTSFAIFRQIGPEAEILTLATHPDAQGMGYGKTMLRHAITTLRQIGVEQVFLDVEDGNVAARALYSACDFKEFARRHNYYKNSATAICMKAVLSPASPA